MKLSPSSILSFLLLLVWSSLSIAAVLPDATDNAIDTASYDKRGAVVSKLKGPKVYPDVPTVAQLVVAVKAKGTVQKSDSLFYADMGGGGAQDAALAWHRANVEKKTNGRQGVVFRGICNDKWYVAQAEALDKFSDRIEKVDLFQKRLSQAFAEVANGNVYFFTAAGNDGTKMSEKTTWATYEFPALTRNPAVKQVIQVSMRGRQATQHVIWKKGDRPTAKAPLGDAPLPAAPGQHNPSP